jgi:cytochrome c
MVRSAAAIVALVAAAALAGPAAADGAKTFLLQCATCHQAKSSPMGPGLAGVAGRKIASAADFAYSPALTAKGGTWTDANLDSFLSGPAKFAPGTKMPVSVAAAPDRVAVIAYLKTLK